MGPLEIHGSSVGPVSPSCVFGSMSLDGLNWRAAEGRDGLPAPKATGWSGYDQLRNSQAD